MAVGWGCDPRDWSEYGLNPSPEEACQLSGGVCRRRTEAYSRKEGRGREEEGVGDEVEHRSGSARRNAKAVGGCSADCPRAEHTHANQWGNGGTGRRDAARVAVEGGGKRRLRSPPPAWSEARRWVWGGRRCGQPYERAMASNKKNGGSLSLFNYHSLTHSIPPFNYCLAFPFSFVSHHSLNAP